MVFHPELRISTPYREWNFGPDITRMPEFCAPALGNRANEVTIDAEMPENASGVLYALGSGSGGLTAYLDDGYLCFEYNLFILMRTKIRSEQRLPAGPATIKVATEVPRRGADRQVERGLLGRCRRHENSARPGRQAV